MRELNNRAAGAYGGWLNSPIAIRENEVRRMSRKLFALCLCLSFFMSGLQSGLGAQQPTPSPTPAPEAPRTQEERKQAEQKDRKEEKWDVEADHGPSTTVEFDTDEGTWMSCDVSPDGQRVVF